MASIRKHYAKWQVHIRKKFSKPIDKSFASKIDAERYIRQIHYLKVAGSNPAPQPKIELPLIFDDCRLIFSLNLINKWN